MKHILKLQPRYYESMKMELNKLSLDYLMKKEKI